MEMKNNNCIVHVRTDSDNDLEALFNHVMKPKTAPKTPTSNQSLPMRERKLPPSFFKPPPEKGAAERNESGLMISHSRAHSSPASLTIPPPNHSLTPNHARSATLDESTTLLPGWEMRTAPGGERYFMK